jgi:hypothetical protein
LGIQGCAKNKLDKLEIKIVKVTPDYQAALSSSLRETALQQAKNFRRRYLKMKRTRAQSNQTNLVRKRYSVARKRPRYNPQVENLRTELIRKKLKYVDGYLDVAAIHELSDTADDTWADCEKNPRQQTAVYGCLPIPAQGDGYNNRDDRKIKIMKIKIRGYIEFAEESGLTQANINKFVRIVVCKDTRTGGTSAQAENVIGAGKGSDDQATFSGDGGAINFFTNPDGWGRYEVIKDFIVQRPTSTTFNDGTDGNQTGVQVPFKITIKPECVVNFSGTTGAIGSVIDNSFHLFVAASSDRQAAPNISYYARTSFVDD